MEVIYVDRYFLMNLLIDYLLCLVSARISGLVLKRRRYLLAALLGAGYAVLTLLPGLRMLGAVWGQLGAAALMALIAYGGEARAWRCALVFLAVSAAFGGALWAISLSGGRPVFDLRVLFLSFALCYGGLSLLFRARAQALPPPRVEVRLRLGGRESRFMAMVDSGNRLCDPLSGCPVMLASPHALAPLFPGADLRREAVELVRQEGLPVRLRLIPYRAVGGSGLLAVFRPEAAELGGRPWPELLVALSPSAGGDGFEAIAPCRQET